MWPLIINALLNVENHVLNLLGVLGGRTSGCEGQLMDSQGDLWGPVTSMEDGWYRSLTTAAPEDVSPVIKAVKVFKWTSRRLNPLYDV